MACIDSDTLGRNFHSKSAKKGQKSKGLLVQSNLVGAAPALSYSADGGETRPMNDRAEGFDSCFPGPRYVAMRI